MPKKVVAILSLSLSLFAFGCAKHELTSSEKKPSNKVTIGLLNWPTTNASSIDDITECLSKRIKDSCRKGNLVQQEAIRKLLFPLMEPATQPNSEKAFLELLSRNDVQTRLREGGFRFLVTLIAKTNYAPPEGYMTCSFGYGGGGCLGLTWIDEDTAIETTTWNLDDLAETKHLKVTAEGTTWVPAYFAPIPILANTDASACQQTSALILQHIKSLNHGNVCQ